MERLEKGAATVRYVHTVNGGRLTKWKGQLASCAPMVGLAVAMLAGANPAMAANECGPDGPGADTVVCAAGNYAGGGTYPDYPTGISYGPSAGLTLELNDPTITVGSPGVVMTSSLATTNAVQVNALDFGTITGGISVNNRGYGAAQISVDSNGGSSSIQTSNNDSAGVRAAIGTGSHGTLAQVTMTDGTVAASGSSNALGITAEVASSSSTADAVANMDGGTITTAGDNSFGVSSRITGLSVPGNATTTVTGGSIETQGSNSYGAYAGLDKFGARGVATTTLTGGDIVTNGASAYGIYARTSGTYAGAAIAQMDGGTVTTSGNSASAVVAAITDNSVATAAVTATATLTGGDVTTTGDAAHGVVARSVGDGETLAEMSGGTITTGGQGADGLYSLISNTGSAATATALLTNGDITTTGTGANGVYAKTAGLGDTVAQMDGGTINTSSQDSSGLYSLITNTSSTATATALLTSGDIVTTGDRSYGIYGFTRGLGAATAQMDGGTINTSGASTEGLVSQIDNASSTATATATLTAGDITTSGIASHGVYAVDQGLGDAVTQMDGGTINTSGRGADGLYSLTTIANSSATATATLTGGGITTTGDQSNGLQSRNYGLGDAVTQMDGGTINTSGVSAHGVYSQITNTSSTGTATATLTNGDITTTGAGANAVYAQSNGLGDTLAQMDGSTINTSGGSANGLYSTGGNTATALLTNGDITTTGADANAVYARNTGAGATLAQMDGGTVNTSGQGANGLYSAVLNTNVYATGPATALLTNGDITTTGDSANAVYAMTNGLGDTLAQMDGGTINTSGASAFGLMSNITSAPSAATATATLTAGDITTIGSSSHGVNVVNGGTGDAVAQMGGGTINTSGPGAVGMLSEISNSNSSATASTTLTAGDITTTGNSSFGVYTLNQGLGAATAQMDGGTINTSGVSAYGLISNITNASSTATATATLTNGDITTTGADSDGIVAVNFGTGVVDVVMNGGTVTSGSGLAAGIRTVTATGGTVYIGSSATIDGSASGIAIRDGDLAPDGSHDGIDEVGGNIVVTTEGNVIGDAILGLGDDTFNFVGGDYDGDIYGDDVVASAADGNDTFNWSGGTWHSAFYGGNGSDTANVTAATYDGTHILDGGDDTSAADGWIDTLTLQGVTATTTGANLKNWENIVIDGSNLTISDGMLSTGSDAGTGLTVTNGGVLNAGTALVLMGNMTVDSNSTFNGFGAGTGVYSISGNVTNNGTISTLDGVAGDAVTIAGNYTGNGQLLFDVNTSNDTHDTVTINGNASGTTTVVVNNLTPDAATGNPLNLVTVTGATTANSFVLAGGSITAGAYDYGLNFSNGSFLLAPQMNSTGAVYEAAPVVLAGFNRLPTLEERVGQRQWAGSNSARSALQPSAGAWVRMHGERSKMSTTSGNSIDNTSWGFQMGWDALVKPSNHGQWVLGLTTQYGTQNANITMPTGGSGSIRAKGYGVGATATLYGNEGTYVDMQAQMNWVNSNFASSKAGSLADGKRARTHAESVEVGHRIELNPNNTLVPQAQLTAGRVSANTFTDSVNNEVDLGSNSSLVGRVGLAYQYENNTAAEGSRQKFYAIGNVLHNFAADSSVTVGGGNLTTGVTRTWGEVGVGSSVTLDDNKTLYGSVAYRHSLDGTRSSGMAVTAGLRVQW